MNEFLYFIDAIPDERFHPLKGVIWGEDIVKEGDLSSLEGIFKKCIRDFESYILGFNRDDRRIVAEQTTRALIEACNKAERHRLVLKDSTDKKTNAERALLEIALHNGIKDLMESMRLLEVTYSADFINELKVLAKDVYYITHDDKEIKANRTWLRMGIDILTGKYKQDITHVNAQCTNLVNQGKGDGSKEKSKDIIKKRASKALGYNNIFRSPWKEHLDELERILNTHGYISKRQWIGENGKKGELAELYHYLKMENIIAKGEEAGQLIALYSEFGLSVGKDNTRNGEYCTLRTLRKANGDSDTKERFKHILNAWIDQRFTI